MDSGNQVGSSVIDIQAVQNFLRLARGAQNKDDFLSRTRQFDQKFIDSYPAPTLAPLPNIPKSSSQSKPTINEIPKNPFINGAQEKYRMQRQSQTATQFKYPQMPQQQIPMQMQMPRNRVQVPPNLPHSRSENNFYRQEDQTFEDFGGVNNTYAFGNDGYDREDYYRQQMNRSYSQQQDPKSKTGFSQPYIQQNEFIANYETEEPEYVKYYKKMIPQPNPKTNFSQTPRANPFKQ